ncbi:hypothetical protein DVH24_039908 [Malus domestica]|uniref:Uncharacterized protein n=1 Tax=Malus domestica TaxID=3750 RepID=A0A498I7J6_MALDO|nr:hypothetical protein DVH24_039908 [Malus domestica]
MATLMEMKILVTMVLVLKDFFEGDANGVNSDGYDSLEHLEDGVGEAEGEGVKGVDGDDE